MVKSDEAFKCSSCQFQFSKYPFKQVSLRGKSNGMSFGKFRAEEKEGKNLFT
jgi:hypothetical protein